MMKTAFVRASGPSFLLFRWALMSKLTNLPPNFLIYCLHFSLSLVRKTWMVKGVIFLFFFSFWHHLETKNSTRIFPFVENTRLTFVPMLCKWETIGEYQGGKSYSNTYFFPLFFERRFLERKRKKRDTISSILGWKKEKNNGNGVEYSRFIWHCTMSFASLFFGMNNNENYYYCRERERERNFSCPF